MKRVYILFIALLAFAFESVAQESISRSDIRTRAIAYTNDAYAESVAQQPVVPQVATAGIPSVDNNHFLQLGIGAPSLVQMMLFGFAYGVDTDEQPMPSNFSEELAVYRYYWDKEYMFNAINVEYGTKIRDWLALGVKGYVGFLTRARRHDVTDELLYRSSNVATSAIFNVRFDYLRREWVTLYSSLGVGVAALIEHSYSEVFPMYDIALVGLDVGKRFYGYLELGTGVCGSLRVGVGVRF